MRDINAAGDIVNCNITEYVGEHPRIEILQATAEELAEAERGSKRVVRVERQDRAKKAASLAGVALIFAIVSAALGYFWLFDSGKATVGDLIHDVSNGVIAALICVVMTGLCSLVFASVVSVQMKPTQAESLNQQRLGVIETRWRELKALGLRKSEIKKIRN